MKWDIKIAIACIIILVIATVILNNGINWTEFSELLILFILLFWLADIKIPIEIPGFIKIGEELKVIGEKLINISQNISNIKIINEFIGQKSGDSYTFTGTVDNVSSDIAKTQLTTTDEKLKNH